MRKSSSETLLSVMAHGQVRRKVGIRRDSGKRATFHHQLQHAHWDAGRNESQLLASDAPRLQGLEILALSPQQPLGGNELVHLLPGSERS